MAKVRTERRTDAEVKLRRSVRAGKKRWGGYVPTPTTADDQAAR